MRADVPYARAGHAEQGPDARIGRKHVPARRSLLDDGRSHSHEVGDPLRLRAQFQEGEHHHAAQTVANPVHAALTRLALHIIEDGRHVVPDQIVDRPARFPAFAEGSSAEKTIEPVLPSQPRVLSGGPDVVNVNLVSTLGELCREVIIGEGPERRVQPHAVTENHRQLAWIRMRRAIVAHAQPPTIPSIRETIRARPEVGTGSVCACWHTPRVWHPAGGLSLSLACIGA